MIAIIDYKAGNLTSVKYAFDALGAESVVTSNPAVIGTADRIVFPGVGAAKSAMANLASLGLVDVVRKVAQEKPFFGICLGMQILFDRTEEDGGVDCLGLIPGNVRRFPNVPGCKIPHMGWNNVECRMKNEECGTSSNIPHSSILIPHSSFLIPNFSSLITNYFYFVHSYFAPVCEFTTGVTEFAGVEFTSVVQSGNITATQFHPEKSGAAGLALLKGWLSC